MTRKLNAFIKMSDKVTNILVTDDSRIVLWDAVKGGRDLVVSDVANCLRVKPVYAEELIKGKGDCLIENINNRDDQLLAEIIKDRIENIFSATKELIEKATLLQAILQFHVIKDAHYITNMESVLSRITGVDADTITPQTLKINISKISMLSKVLDTYF